MNIMPHRERGNVNKRLSAFALFQRKPMLFGMDAGMARWSYA
jgi:hypothetical protein